MRQSTEPVRSKGRPRRVTEGARPPVVNGRVLRFDRLERATHWVTALGVLTLATTGLILYVPSFSAAFGRRLLVENTHVWVGVFIFVPLLLALAAPAGRRLRRDLSTMSRFTPGELRWLRTRGRDGRESVAKFNPGQKLNTNVIGSMLTVLFVTGLILRWGNFLPVGLRTGATFIHDVFALLLIALIVAHIAMALAHPPALRSMLQGWVPGAWLRRHAPAWVPGPDELLDADPSVLGDATGESARAPG